MGEAAGVFKLKAHFILQFIPLGTAVGRIHIIWSE